MKIILTVLILMPSCFFSQTNEDTTSMWFEYVFKVDGEMTRSAQEFMLKDIYTTNLNIVNTQIKDGLVTNKLISTYNKNTNDNIKNGIYITFWHVLKYNPSLILNPDYISFIENEIKNNDFDEKLLINMFKDYYRIFLNPNPEKNQDLYAKSIDHDYDLLFYDAIKRWNIEEQVKINN